MVNEPWKKRKNRFDFFLDLSDMDRLFSDLLKGFDSMEEIPRKPLVMGFNVKVGPDGQPIIERFGNVRASEGKPVVADAREPLVDVTKSKGEITITAELPGVEKRDISVRNPDSKTVEISVSGEKPFYKRVLLDAAVKPKSAKAKFKNGILEVAFRKEREAAAGEKGVKIE